MAVRTLLGDFTDILVCELVASLNLSTWLDLRQILVNNLSIYNVYVIAICYCFCGSQKIRTFTILNIREYLQNLTKTHTEVVSHKDIV